MMQVWLRSSWTVLCCSASMLIAVLPAFSQQEEGVLIEQVVIVNEISESMLRRGPETLQDVGIFHPRIGVYWRLWLMRGEEAWYAFREPSTASIRVLHRDGARWIGYEWLDGKCLWGFETFFGKGKEGAQQSKQFWMRLVPDAKFIERALLGFRIAEKPREEAEAFNVDYLPPVLLPPVWLRSFPVVDNEGACVGSYHEWYLRGLEGWQAIIGRQAYLQGRLVYQEYTLRRRPSRRGDENLYPFLQGDKRARRLKWSVDNLQTALRMFYGLGLSGRQH